MHPALKALMLMCLVMIMVSVSVFIGGLLALPICGMGIEDIASLLNNPNEASICSMKVLNAAQQILGFLGASVIAAVLLGKRSFHGFMLHSPSITILLVPLLLVFSLPLIEAAYEINVSLIPEGSWLESYFKPMEERAAELTEIILAGNDIPTLLTTLLVIAVLPAICEEFLFRGALMPLLAKSTGNMHLAVWLSAFIFSFFHLQFYGFLPRMLLGVYFGYLVIATRSIWPAILAHFLNNGVAAVGYYLSNNGVIDNIEDLESSSLTLLPLLISAVSFSLLFFMVLQRSRWKEFEANYLSREGIEDSTGS